MTQEEYNIKKRELTATLKGMLDNEDNVVESYTKYTEDNMECISVHISVNGFYKYCLRLRPDGNLTTAGYNTYVDSSVYDLLVDKVKRKEAEINYNGAVSIINYLKTMFNPCKEAV